MKSNSTDAQWRFDREQTFTRDPQLDRESYKKYDVFEGLVREVIQNSLDARLPGQNRLAMLFSFNKINKVDVQDYIASLLPHLEANKVPITGEKVLSDETRNIINTSPLFDVLCIEDLGTTGLEGEITKVGEILTGGDWDVFFRGEGLSSKSGEKGGRWGQGKTTFNMASRIKSFWGLTIRHSDNKEYLMGKTLLSPHEIEGESFQYHGLYSYPDAIPISDRKFLREFKRKMNCQRKSGESGLSLIIPYPVENVTLESIEKAAIIHYFYPIIKKDLPIKIIKKDGESHDLTDSTIVEIAESLDWRNTSWERRSKRYILDILTFTKACVNMSSNRNIMNLPDKVASECVITEDIIKNNIDVEDLRNRFNSGEHLGFNIPINIVLKDERVKKSHFEIFIKKYTDGSMTGSDEHFFRSGISLPEERGRLGGRPVRGILVAEDAAISEFLGDAEEPHHTRWNERREGFSEKYNLHQRTLRFIRNAMSEIVGILDIVTEKRDYDILEHIFAIPDLSDEITDEPEKEPDKEPVTIGPKPPIEPIPQSVIEFAIDPISNGLRVRCIGNDDYFPVKARLRIAYDVPYGNPFSNFEPYDFDLTKGQLNMEVVDCDITRTEPNVLWLEFLLKSSSITITGFDPNRDLITHIMRVNL